MSIAHYMILAGIAAVLITVEVLLARQYPRVHKQIQSKLKTKARMLSVFMIVGLFLVAIGTYLRLQTLAFFGFLVLVGATLGVCVGILVDDAKDE